MSSVIEAVRERLARFPRLARFGAVAVVLGLVGYPLMQALPQDVVVHYDFGADHRNVYALRVAYLPVGQASTRVITQRFPDGAPRNFDHPVDLPLGRYELHGRIETQAGEREFERFIEIGSRGSVDVDLTSEQ